jgi:DNA-binding NarL/FixJ family response regulator
MKILFVDDHPMVLYSLSTLLQAQGNRVDAVQNCQQARDALAAGNHYDLLLLDYNLPDGNPLDLLRDALAESPHKVVVISGISDGEEALYILETSAVDAFIPKSIDLDDLVLALEQVMGFERNGETWIWQSDKRSFVTSARAYAKETTLSPKEREVFMLMRKGLLDKQIADHLHRSIHTVRVQIRAIRRKRGTTRRAEIRG